MKSIAPITLPTRAAMLAVLRRRKITVVMGGLSAEREISLLTGQAMLRALRGLKLNAQGMDLKGPVDLLRLLRQKPDVVVNGLHGPGGEDGQLQGLLTQFQIPFTGPGVFAASLAMDKHRTKLVLRGAGLPTAPWVLCNRPVKRLPVPLTLPVVVKPNRQGSAIGVSIVHKASELAVALEQAGRYGDEIVIEKFVAGREISIGILGGQALPVIEIVPKKAFYDYEAKYVAGMSEHIIPARLSPAKTREVQQLAVLTARALGCQGTPRIDMIVPAKSGVMILEVNTLPGMTSTSLLPDAARFAGVDFERLVLALIWEALGFSW